MAPNSDHGGVAVVGSANLDIVVRLARFPAPGETVLGEHLEEVAGGKGLNQAVAAAPDGRCAFVGAVGGDDAGRMLLDLLEQSGVDTTQVIRLPQPTGRAFIEVTPDGENRIVVLPLANGHLGADAACRALAALAPSLVLAQLEVPIATVAAVGAWAATAGARFVLNASPVAVLDPELLRACDPLIVNRHEASAILASGGTSLDPRTEVSGLAARLAEQVRSIVVTDGPRGAHVGSAADGITHVPGEPVPAVDTTGAGDAFAGTLASALAAGARLDVAAERGNRAAAGVIQLPRDQR